MKSPTLGFVWCHKTIPHATMSLKAGITIAYAHAEFSGCNTFEI